MSGSSLPLGRIPQRGDAPVEEATATGGGLLLPHPRPREGAAVEVGPNSDSAPGPTTPFRGGPEAQSTTSHVLATKHAADHRLERVAELATRAALSMLLGVCAAEPLLLQILRRRVLDERVLPPAPVWQARLDDFTHVGTAVLLVLIGIALLRPRQVLRAAHLPLALAAVLWMGASVANTHLGARTGRMDYTVFALVVVAALGVLRPAASFVVPQIRWWLGVYVYGSLLALLVAHDWAMIPVPDGLGRPAGQPRLWGISDHPNHLAPLAALLVTIELTSRGSRLRRTLNLLAGAAVMLLTGTATAIAAVLLVVAYLAVRHIRSASSRRGVGKAVLGSAIATALVVGMTLAIRPEFASEWHVLLTADGRTTIWSAAIHVWRDHPLLGYGPFVFDQQAQLAYLGPHSANLDSAHSQYFQAFAQGGLFLGSALVVYVGSLVVAARRGPVGPEGAQRVAALILLLTTMATEVVLRVGPSSSFFLLHIAVLLILLGRPGLIRPSRSGDVLR